MSIRTLTNQWQFLRSKFLKGEEDELRQRNPRCAGRLLQPQDAMVAEEDGLQLKPEQADPDLRRFVDVAAHLEPPTGPPKKRVTEERQSGWPHRLFTLDAFKDEEEGPSPRGTRRSREGLDEVGVILPPPARSSMK